MKSNLYFSDDIADFIYLLYKYKVKYVIVGGEAVIYYGHARLTGDIDFFYSSTDENCKKLYDALNEFWDGRIPGITDSIELTKLGMVFQFGVPPNRIDLINTIENVEFDEAWDNKFSVDFGHKKEKIFIYYIGLRELVKNKKSISRPRDKEDLKFLKEILKKKE